jgi:hypothetical protein
MTPKPRLQAQPDVSRTTPEARREQLVEHLAVLIVRAYQVAPNLFDPVTPESTELPFGGLNIPNE